MMEHRQLRDLPLDQQSAVRGAVSTLEREFTGVFGRETIEQFVIDSLEQLLTSAKATTFLSIFAERFARERLTAVGKTQGTIASALPSVLFLCVHNAGRSQMAAGWLRKLAPGEIDVYSGGSEPASQINPAVIDAMDEVGVDIRAEFPKPWTDEVVGAVDVVVTMGCGDACPILPGKRYEDWELTDPASRTIEEVRPIRDEIRVRVEALMASLGVGTH